MKKTNKSIRLLGLTKAQSGTASGDRAEGYFPPATDTATTAV